MAIYPKSSENQNIPRGILPEKMENKPAAKRETKGSPTVNINGKIHNLFTPSNVQSIIKLLGSCVKIIQP